MNSNLKKVIKVFNIQFSYPGVGFTYITSVQSVKAVTEDGNSSGMQQ